MPDELAIAQQQTSRDLGNDFEEEVKTFLEEKFKFEHVQKNLHIAPTGNSNEVDVCGKFGNILFVFQCRAAGRRSSPDLREKILAMKERSRIVLENYKKIPEYVDCKFVIFIFITKKIDISEANLKLLKEINPRIWYADEKMLEYYSDLYDKIGEYAVYNFLADFSVRPPPSEQLYLTALRTKLDGYTVYSFFVKPKHLLKFSYVARRRSKNEDFYQRMLKNQELKTYRNF
ncbi:MAG: hypothetical protein HYW22_00110 [Candidatus Aenigmarchaeota archaeon]|nr:hypothetical protein [Candidatus Aenigmarchaeota archaeon]